MPKITEMFAFVCEDAPGDEGIIGMSLGRMMWPLVGADMERVNALKPYADQISEQTGKPYKLLKFQLVGEIACKCGELVNE